MSRAYLRLAGGILILAGVLLMCQSVSAQELHVYFGNLHSHTKYSDGSGTPNDAYKHAKNKGHLDFLAITEHNHRWAEMGAKERADGKLIATNHDLYSGSQGSSLISNAAKWTKDGEFVAIYGQEFSSISKGNHVNVFEVPNVIDAPNGALDTLIDLWLPDHPSSDAGTTILQLNHPTDFPDASTEYGRDDFGSEAEWIEALDAHAQLMEILNGPAMKKEDLHRATMRAESDYLRYLNLGFHLAPTGDQDNHYKTWGTISDVRTGVVATALTKSDILNALRNRHVYATEDKNLSVIFKVNGHLCGDRINPAPVPNSELEIEFTLQDEDEPQAVYEIEVYSDQIGGDPAEVIEVVSVEGNSADNEVFAIEDIRYEGGNQYLFFKITQMSEHGPFDLTWTAPVWLEGAGSATGDDSEFVASKRSKVYHVSLECRDAQRIASHNLITGSEAKSGRRLHEGCPR